MPETPLGKRKRDPQDNLLAGFRSAFGESALGESPSANKSAKKPSKAVIDRELREFDRLRASISKPTRPAAKPLDPFSISRPHNVEPSKELFGTTPKKPLKQLAIPPVVATPSRTHAAPGSLQTTSATSSRPTPSKIPPPPIISAPKARSDATSSGIHTVSSLLPNTVPLPTRLANTSYITDPFTSSTSSAQPPVTPFSTRLLANDATSSKLKPSLHKAPMSQLLAPPTFAPARSSTPDLNPEISRGLELSPSKHYLGDKSDRIGRNRQGFILNGFAERAQALFQKNDMEHLMWQTEMSQYSNTHPRKLTSQQQQTPKRKLLPPTIEQPHVKFRILTVCETANPRGKEAGGYIVAKCAIISARSRHRSRPSTSDPTFPSTLQSSGEEGVEAERGANETEKKAPMAVSADEGFVLFSLPPYKNGRPAGPNVCSRESLIEGAEVHVWKPWHEVKLRVDLQGSSGGPSVGVGGTVGKVLMCTKFATI